MGKMIYHRRPRLPPSRLYVPNDTEGVMSALQHERERIAEARSTKAIDGMTTQQRSIQYITKVPMDEYLDRVKVIHRASISKSANHSQENKEMAKNKGKAGAAKKPESVELVPSEASKNVLVWQPTSSEWKDEFAGEPVTTFDKGGMYQLVLRYAGWKESANLNKHFGSNLRKDVDRFLKGANFGNNWLAAGAEYLSARYGVRPFLNVQEVAEYYRQQNDPLAALVTELAELSQGINIPTVINRTWIDTLSEDTHISQGERLERVIESAAELTPETLQNIVAEASQWIVRVHPILAKLQEARVSYPHSQTIFGKEYIYAPESKQYILECKNSVLNRELQAIKTELANVRGAKGDLEKDLRENAGHIAQLQKLAREAEYRGNELFAEQNSSWHQQKLQRALEDHRAIFTTANRVANRRLVGFDEPIVREFVTSGAVYNGVEVLPSFSVIRSLTPKERGKVEAMRNQPHTYKKVLYREAEQLPDGSGVIIRPVTIAQQYTAVEKEYMVYGNRVVVWAKNLNPGRNWMSDMIAKHGSNMNQFFRRVIKRNIEPITWQRRTFEAARTLDTVVDTATRKARHTVKYGHHFGIVRRAFRAIDKIVDAIAMPKIHIDQSSEAITGAGGSTVQPVELATQVDGRLQERMVQPKPDLAILRTGLACPEDRLLLIDAELANAETEAYTVVITSNNSVRAARQHMSGKIGSYLQQLGISHVEEYLSALCNLVNQLSNPQFHSVSMFPFMSLDGDIATKIAYGLEELGMDAMVIKRPTGTTVGEDYIWPGDKFTVQAIKDRCDGIFKDSTLTDVQWAMVHSLIDVMVPKYLDGEKIGRQHVGNLSLISIHHRSESAEQEVLIRELVSEGGVPIEGVGTFQQVDDIEGVGSLSAVQDLDSTGNLALAA
jgi:hypothetical protein